jgi:hypothetical protein
MTLQARLIVTVEDHVAITTSVAQDLAPQWEDLVMIKCPKSSSFFFIILYAIIDVGEIFLSFNFTISLSK